MYIIEGNIGAGKSTFLRLLGKYLPYIAISPEPLHNWQNQMYGQSLLTNFYQDPQRWAYTLETLTLLSRVKEHCAEQGRVGCVVFERSVYSGYYCFAKNSYACGFMSDLEWHAHNTWFNNLIPATCKPPLGFIYLHVDPIVAFKRIKKRNRHAEKNMTLQYINQIAQRHEDFLIKKVDILQSIKEIPVLILDCNEEFETNAENLAAHLEEVQYFMHKTYQTSLVKKHTNSINGER